MNKDNCAAIFLPNISLPEQLHFHHLHHTLLSLFFPSVPNPSTHTDPPSQLSLPRLIHHWFTIRKLVYPFLTQSLPPQHTYRSAGMVGTDTMGAADRFSARILRAFFIFCLDAALAAAFLAESMISSSWGRCKVKTDWPLNKTRSTQRKQRQARSPPVSVLDCKC